MSSTIGTIAGTTGLGSARQAVWAGNSALWWAFQFTGTVTLASWSSPDGVTWTARATHTLPAAHGSEGRDLWVACKTINNIDTVWFGYVITPTSTHTVKALRATISGTTITYHTLDTTISDGTATGALATPAYSSGGWDFDSLSKIHCVNGALDINQNVSATRATDPGAAEQATAPTWTTVVGLQTMAKTTKSGFVADTDSGTVLYLGDDATDDVTCTGLVSHKFDSSTWSSITSPISGIAAINKNDWGAVKRTASDVHMVYRDSTGSLKHKRWNGTAWGAGQTIPAQSNLAGGGIALTSDGASVWLAVIDTDAANTVRYIQWSSGDYTGVGDAWAAAWSVAEASSATRSFLGAVRDVANQTALFYWTEGTSMVAVTASAPAPPDPPGLVNRDALSVLGSSSATNVVTTTFSGAQKPLASRGQKICVGFWASYSVQPTITSVQDNAASVNNYTAVPAASNVGGVQGQWVYWLDLPLNASWTGDYSVTITFSGNVTEADAGAIAISNAQSGAPTATNSATGSSAAAAPGSANPPAAPAYYFVVITDATGANPATFTWPAPFLKEITQSNGSVQQAGSIGDALNNSGAQNPSVTIDNALWNAGIAVWPGAPTSPNIYQPAFPRISGLKVG